MGYAYPRLSNCLIFQPAGNGVCLVSDRLHDTTFSFDNRSAWFIQQLDGRKHPYDISPDFGIYEVDNILALLRAHDLLRDSRVLESGFGHLLYSLWICPIAPPRRKQAAFLNGLLMALFLPIFFGGVFVGRSSLAALATINLGGMLTGLLTGVLLHELGHALAAQAYGAVIFEMGISFHCFIPGAYTLLDIACIENNGQKAQVNAAGVEANFLLSGVFLGLTRVFPGVESFLMWAALENLILALINLMFVPGFDGASVIGALLGCERIVDYAKLFLLDRDWRSALLYGGIQGRTGLIACAILMLFQLSGFTLIILNVVGGLACFLPFG